MRIIMGAAVTVGALAGAMGQSQAAPVNLLLNGSFEAYTGVVFDNWTNGGSQGTTPMQFAKPHPTDGVTPGQFNETVVSAPPGNSPDSAGGGGKQGAYFVADNANPTQTLSQTVALMNGQSYEAGVTLYATTGGAANPNPFTLTVTIGTVAVATVNGTNLTPGIWTPFSTNFIASGTSAVFTLAFDSGPTPAKDIIADLAYVVAPGSPTVEVPEPATIALLGMGLLGLGAVRRRT